MSRASEWGGLAHVSMIRLATLFVWFVTAATTPYQLYPDLTADGVAGFGLGRLLWTFGPTQEILSSWIALTVLRGCVLCGCAIAATTRLARTPVMWVVFIAVLLLDTSLKSIGGFANHAQILPLFSLGLFTIYSTNEFTVIPEFLRRGLSHSSPVGLVNLASRTRSSWVVALFSLIAVLPYTFIGVNRLLYGGFDFFRGPALIGYLSAATQSFRVYPEWFDPSSRAAYLNVGFFGTSLLEATSLLILWSPTYRTVWLVSMACFHLSTLLLMNIFFWENMMLTSVAFWWGWRARTHDAQED